VAVVGVAVVGLWLVVRLSVNYIYILDRKCMTFVKLPEILKHKF
jgi:hypothetical protein